MNKLIILLLCSLSISCVARKPYESVPTEDSAKVNIVKNEVFTNFEVSIFETEKNCSLKYMGTVSLEGEETSKKIFTPAGRFYFNAVGYLGGSGTKSTGARYKSFIVESGKEYTILYENIGSKGIRRYFKFHYLENGIEGQPSKPVDTSQSDCPQFK